MTLSNFFAWLIPLSVTPQAIRAEIYFLGSRHRGEALSGALRELEARDLSPGRTRLLHAVVNQLKRDQKVWAG